MIIQNKDYTFNNPDNYIFDSNDIEFENGEIKLIKNKLLPNCSFLCGYEENINGDLGNGVLIGTPIGGADVSGGELDLSYSDKRYVDYNADLNADSQQTGCIRFKIKPNYNSSPSTEQRFFLISKCHNSTENLIFMRHSYGGALRLHMFGADGTFIFERYLGTWTVVKNQEYEIEVNWDITEGETRIFIDGTQKGITETTKGIRNSNIGLLRIGSDRAANNTSNFKINNFMVFSEVQHTSNYIPASTMLGYSVGNPVIIPKEKFRTNRLLSFIEDAVKIGSDNLLYILEKDGIPYYNNGGWGVSDGTNNQANTASEILSSKDGFLNYSDLCSLRIFLHSDNGLTTPVLKNLEILHSFAGEEPEELNRCLVWGFNRDIEGNPSRTPFKVFLTHGKVRYKEKTIIFKEEVTVTPDIKGYWDIELIENVNMSNSNKNEIKYIFDFTNIKITKKIPNESIKNFHELES